MKNVAENIGIVKKLKKPWITNVIIDKMEERRKWKKVKYTQGKNENIQLNNELRRTTDKAREKW